jgi:hypothetical protein
MSMTVSDEGAHTYFLGIFYSFIGSTLIEPLRFLFLVEKDFDIVDLGFVCVVVWFVIDPEFITPISESSNERFNVCQEYYFP